MKFKDLIRKVQLKSGFSDDESKDALELMVESLAVRLTEEERREFASQLPEPLNDMALSVYPSPENSRIDLIKQFMMIQRIAEDHAKKQIRSAWETLKEALSPDEIKGIRAQLPTNLVRFLH